MVKTGITVSLFILLMILALFSGYGCQGPTKLTVSYTQAPIKLTVSHIPAPQDINDIPVTLSDSPYQILVDSIKALHPTGNYTYDIYCYGETGENFSLNTCGRGEGSFEINEYFTVLTNIEMEDGWVLDYVFYDYYWGSNPIIYVREGNREPFKNYVEYANAKKAGAVAPNQYELVRIIKDLDNGVYENKIKINGTKEGFFEYVVLQELGGQFYLSWHSLYHDTRIICDPIRIDDIVRDIENKNLVEITADVLEQARSLNYEPVITFQDDLVKVSIMIFTKWGGFERVTYTIEREYPHNIVDIQKEVILGYYCGLTY